MSKQLRIWLFVLLGTLLTSTTLLAEGIITLTTSKAVGERIELYISANGSVSINGVQESAQTDGYSKYYTLTSQTITIRGDVTYLKCYQEKLTRLDVSGCTSLTKLYCQQNQLTSLNVSGCTSLTKLYCQQNQLTSLDVSKNTTLTELNCGVNQLTSLDVSKNTALTKLDCSSNQLTSLDVSKNSTLTELDCSSNQLTHLDVSKNSTLTELICGGNQLTHLDVSKNTALTKLNCYNNQLTSLDVSGCTALRTLYCEYNQLTSLDVSGCTALTRLDCQENQLTSLDVSKKNSLTRLDCKENRLTSLDASGCTSLIELDCSNNLLNNLNLSGCVALTKLVNKWLKPTRVNLSNCKSLKEFSCRSDYLISLDVSGCTTLTELNCKGSYFEQGGLTSLDVSSCTALTKLICEDNRLTSLDVSKNTALTELDCQGNQLTSLNVSGCTALTKLDCSFNLLRQLNIAGCTSLSSLNCSKNQIKATEMANLVNSLPSRQETGEGSFGVFDERDPYGCILDEYEEGNVCYAAHIATAKAKNWRTLFYRKGNWHDYAGLDNPTFVVTYSYNIGGSIVITGADDLQSVSYDTELTVTETSVADGYKLTKLTANGQDILETKRFKVTKNTSVSATFALEFYSVTTTKLGEGTLYVSGADDLEAVTPGTELTITADPAEGYELTELTANGQSILDTKKVIVNEDLIIRAIFSKKTFKVSLEPRGKGTIKVVGAEDLNAVPYGTELTIVATPEEGSELASLIAGGINITETKKVTIKKETTIEAVFTTQSFAVTLTKEGEETISATGVDNLDAVDYGTELTIVATPATGYELTALTANGTDILATKKVVIKGATEVKATFAKKSFAVTFEKEGEGTITATGASNLNSVAYGTELTIVATPAEGYELTALTANGTDILATKKVVVTDNMTVKATFAKKSFAVSLTKEGEGTITATGATSLDAVAYGTELTIVATPAAGYELVSITAGGTDITASKKVVVTGNLTIKATFAKKNFAVSLTKEGEGTITATGASNLNSVAYGTELTIVATPAEGYELVSITAGGTDITASKKVVVTGNLTVKATFTKKNFAVSLTKEGEGTITATSASDLNSVAYGTELTINATPARGYELVSITAGGTDITATKKVVVTGNLTVKATFAKKNFAVSLTKEGEGTITATGASNLNSVAYGTELTIVATPAKGYELVSITAGGADITATKKIVVKDNLTVKATFAKKSFAVSLTKEGEGTITATGASNLNAVAYGTELTINATPAEGYELTALTANGTDILATKQVVVEGNLTVKATFTKKTFAVTLTSNEHGNITIVEPVNLEAVSYGTTLTIVATPAAGYKLTALTANGQDILATKKVVVKGATEVKATFVDHTGVETTVTQQVQLYPNPATDYVIVEGVAPASEVTLHSMTGERLYAGRADSRGVLQIDLTPYADGVYLVCVAGETYRVVVRR
ncbi:InlB B-repeat-containing protein [Porphyromonas uenonis]